MRVRPSPLPLWSDGRTVLQRAANSPTLARLVGSNPTRSVRIRSSNGRTPAFQAGGNGFDPRLMLSCAGGQIGKGAGLRNQFLRVRLPPRVLRSAVSWNGPSDGLISRMKWVRLPPAPYGAGKVWGIKLPCKQLAAGSIPACSIRPQWRGGSARVTRGNPALGLASFPAASHG